MNLAIIGNRNCPPVDIGRWIKSTPDALVIGSAKCVDRYAAEYAQKHNI